MIKNVLLGFIMLLTTATHAQQPTTSAAQQTAQIETQTLLDSPSSWDGNPYETYPAGQPRLTIKRIKIPANTNSPWHGHLIPSAIFIVAGELELEVKESGKSIRLSKGDTLAEMVNIKQRYRTGDRPVEFIAFYARAVKTAGVSQ